MSLPDFVYNPRHSPPMSMHEFNEYMKQRHQSKEFREDLWQLLRDAPYALWLIMEGTTPVAERPGVDMPVSTFSLSSNKLDTGTVNRANARLAVTAVNVLPFLLHDLHVLEEKVEKLQEALRGKK